MFDIAVYIKQLSVSVKVWVDHLDIEIFGSQLHGPNGTALNMTSSPSHRHVNVQCPSCLLWQVVTGSCALGLTFLLSRCILSLPPPSLAQRHWIFGIKPLGMG